MASQYHTGGSWISPIDRLACYLRDEFECAYCARDLHHEKRANVTLDHLLSRDEYHKLDAHTQEQFGDVNATHNLVTACKPCNSRRGNTPWQQFADDNARARIIARTYAQPNRDLAAAIIKGEN